MGNEHTMRGMNSVNSLWDLSFFELWHPLMFLVLIIIAFIYIKLVKSKESNYSKSKMFYFLCGLLLLYVSEGSPLKAFGHHFLFTAHMLSMSITYFAVPPLVLGGLYDWMVIPLLKIKGVKKFIQFITHPLLAVTLFNLLLSFYHIPLLFNKIMESAWAMGMANVILTFLAFVMWWLVVHPEIVGLRSLKPLPKIGYVFAASILLTPACAIIMFSDHIMYTKVAAEQQIFHFLPPLMDQKSGGVIMKIFQELVFIATLAYIFVQWAKTDLKSEDNDLNPKVNLVTK
ncbi:MAG: cytochrome c oxidase assembly protein [Tuberibacillus sp.]